MNQQQPKWTAAEATVQLGGGGGLNAFHMPYSLIFTLDSAVMCNNISLFHS